MAGANDDDVEILRMHREPGTEWVRQSYLPMQNLVKMWKSRSSGVTAPGHLFEALACARARSTSTSSSGGAGDQRMRAPSVTRATRIFDQCQMPRRS